MKGTSIIQLRSFRTKRKCGFVYHNKCVKSTWVANKYKAKIRLNPRIDLPSFRRKVMNENKFFLSKDQGYRAKRLALSMIHGSEEDQYNKINEHIHEVKRSNLGITVVMKMVDGYCDTSTNRPKFQRLYMCFTTMREGFLARCRPLFGLGGTFLKKSIRGMLLISVGIDPNNGFFPIAYAACEEQNKDSWAWFLNLLKEYLMIKRDYEWTLMSNKQKGIIKACEAVFPNFDHRFCVKHLQSNWSQAIFKGKALSNTLWAAVKATTIAQFICKMQEIAEIDLDAAKWLDEKGPNEWTRAHFRTLPKCDMLLNNICESFNSKILDAREEFILSMMESLRKYIMNRMQENRDRANASWITHIFCPKIMKRMKKNIKHAATMIPHKANDTLYEVACPCGDVYVVNVSKRTRGCSRNSGGICYLTQEALTQWDAPGTQEACATTIPNSLKTKKLGFPKERKNRVIVHCVRVKALKRVADAFKRLYDALENLTCSVPAKEPDLFQVFIIEKSVTTQSSQPSKGKRNSSVKRAQGTWNLP
ncbi:hypothetical protein ACH5RR_036986 [Cinchona calisaya]|uniref:MULE transposase domain-containing protein n=1 Tax=Cinchona calisaya TaxID=153742 RepID=A0ABD2Y7X6_9GENT